MKVGSDGGHKHGADQEPHLTVQHDDHFDFVHDGRLHHKHDEHMDDHGEIALINAG